MFGLGGQFSELQAYASLAAFRVFAILANVNIRYAVARPSVCLSSVSNAPAPYSAG